MDIRQALARLLEQDDLTQSEAQEVMEQIMRGEATPSQIGGFLVALRLKGETVDEVTGFARAMRRSRIQYRVPCLYCRKAA